MGAWQPPLCYACGLAQEGFIFADLVCAGGSSELESGDPGVCSSGSVSLLRGLGQVTFSISNPISVKWEEKEAPPSSGGLCVRGQ